MSCQTKRGRIIQILWPSLDCQWSQLHRSVIGRGLSSSLKQSQPSEAPVVLKRQKIGISSDDPISSKGSIAQVPVSDNLPTGPTVATLLDPVEAGGGMDLEEPAAALGGPCEWECPGP